MPTPIRGLSLIALPLLVTCGPLVQTVRTPAGMSTSVECKNIGSELFVDFRIAPIPEGTPCQVAFEGTVPEKLEVLTQNGQSLLRWKVDQAHLKAFSIHFYTFKLTTPSDAYSISIKLQPASQQVAAATLQSLLRLH